MPRDLVDVAAASTVAAASSLALLSIPAAVGADSNLLATAALVAVCLPTYLRHVVYAMNATAPPRSALSLTILAVLVIAPTPLLGAAWLNTLHVVAVVAVLTVRPWIAVPIALFLVVLTGPWAYQLGASGPDAVWLSVTTGMRTLAVYSLVWMVVALRRLQATAEVLAARAVAGERLRIDRELTRTVQHALVKIRNSANRTATLVARGDLGAAQAELVSLSDVSRCGLADARQLVRGFRQPILRREIESASDLLAAAGIDVRIELPANEIPEEATAALRAMLHSVMTDLLRDGAPGPVVIAVRRVSAGWVLSCVTEPAPAVSA